MSLPLSIEDRRIIEEIYRLNFSSMTYWHIVQTVADRLRVDEIEVNEAIIRALDRGCL